MVLGIIFLGGVDRSYRADCQTGIRHPPFLRDRSDGDQQHYECSFIAHTTSLDFHAEVLLTVAACRTRGKPHTETRLPIIKAAAGATSSQKIIRGSAEAKT